MKAQPHRDLHERARCQSGLAEPSATGIDGGQRPAGLAMVGRRHPAHLGQSHRRGDLRHAGVGGDPRQHLRVAWAGRNPSRTARRVTAAGRRGAHRAAAGLGPGSAAFTCACSCITLSDQTRAILVAATERAGDELPLTERVRRLLAQCGAPIAAFSSTGKLIHASVAARIRLAGATSLAALGAQAHAETARRSGSAAGASTAGPLAIERIDTEAASILIVIFGEAATRTPSGVAVASLPPPADSVAAEAARRVPCGSSGRWTRRSGSRFPTRSRP